MRTIKPFLPFSILPPYYNDVEVYDLAGCNLTELISDINFPHFVSYPRSGNHFLIILLEKYFDKSIIPFSINMGKEIFCSWDHDTDAGKKYKRVFNLYRKDIVANIFSYMYYINQLGDVNIFDIQYNVRRYTRHLWYWTMKNFTHEIDEMIITEYDELIKNPVEEFKKIVEFFKEDFDEEQFEKIYKMCDKKFVYDATQQYECNVMKLFTDEKYKIKREEFRTKYSDLIYKFREQELISLNETKMIQGEI